VSGSEAAAGLGLVFLVNNCYIIYTLRFFSAGESLSIYFSGYIDVKNG
jgi:hypothetical protein